MGPEVQLPRSSSQARSPSLRDLAAVFFRHQRLFVASFVVVLVGGTLYAAFSPSYRAQMKVVVRRGRIDPAVTPTQTAAPLPQTEVVTEEEMNSEIELLRDQDVLRQVVARTGLAQRHSILGWLRRGSSEEKMQRAVQRLAQDLDVQPVRKSQVITISYSSPEPQLAATVLKNLGEVYLGHQTQVQRPAGQQAFFDDQASIARRELRRIQNEAGTFARTRGVAAAALERDLALQKLSDAQANEFGLQASLAEVQGKVRSLGEQLQELPPRRVSQVRNADNPELQEKLKSKLLELQLQRTTLLTRFQPSYRLVQEVDKQIAETRATLEAENLAPLRDELTEDNPDYTWATSEQVKAGVELQALRSRLAVAREQVAAYQSRAQQLARQTIEQNDLEQKLKAAEDKYLLYANKREEARIGDALDRTGILNVAIAQPPRAPALPTTPFWLAAGLSFLAACAVSTATVFVVDYLDPSLRTPAEVITLLRTPVLASLPVRAAKDTPGFWTP